ncbi:MAG: DNA alkylation repair protein [Gammaproteobacteria bacterium]|nr:DNA alkylation repair protein [Gammaproteobacteria bacterium]
MNDHEIYLKRLKDALKNVSTTDKAEASRRYFPNGVNLIGATAPDIKLIIADFQSEHTELTAIETLSLTESLLRTAVFTEEVLLAFGLINKFVKNNYDEDLLLRFEFWLENYATNWALVDDLCIKTIYQFLLSRPHLIEKTQHWAHSKVPWCRRASNVVWVKFIKRKMGKSTYNLDKELVFKNCDLLIGDGDEFVQKSVGWLLKVTSLQHEGAVIEYIQNNFKKMTRPTIRYAIEKMDTDTRKRVLAIAKEGYAK